jgi:hypothetical protein
MNHCRRHHLFLSILLLDVIRGPLNLDGLTTFTLKEVSAMFHYSPSLVYIASSN